MKWGSDFRTGLNRKDAEKDVEPFGEKRIDGMRRAIENGRRDSALIHQCLMSAEVNGLRGEDKYVLLAYHALILLEEHAQRTLDMLNTQPTPPFIIGSGHQTEADRG